MLIKTYSKTVFENKMGGLTMNFPRDVFNRFGKNYILEFHHDKIVMIPIKQIEE